MKRHDAREGNEAVEHGTPVTTSQSEPGGGLANTREGQMGLQDEPTSAVQNANAVIDYEARRVAHEWIRAHNESFRGPMSGWTREQMSAYHVELGLLIDFVTTPSVISGLRSAYAPGASSQTPSPSLPAVPDAKEEEQTLEEPGDVAANTVQGPMALPEWFRELKSMRSQVPRGPFWWAQNYQLEEYHWALNDPESNKDGRVSDIYTILEASYPTATDGKKVGKQLFPRLIVKSLNALPELLELAEKALLSAQEPNFDAASEFSQTSFETGGRNAPNLQMALMGRVRDGLKVGFVAGCHCGGKENPDWRNHAENCSARYFGKLIEELDVALQDARVASDGKEQGTKLGKPEAQ